jgi:cyanophycinase
MRIGHPADATAAAPRPGFALMGGGKDLDEAFRWLCQRAAGGDFLILRATGGDDYNKYVQSLCTLNSVATLILPSRAAAQDPSVARIIAHANALFISGGDQANYINFWMDTPVQSALNDAIHRGIPIGGTSAGLAVLGEWAYSAQGDKPNDPNLDAAMALADPFSPRVTLVHGFLDIPVLKGIITDTHFAKRDRMGRLLAFLARINAAGADQGTPPVRGIGVDEGAAVLLTPDGHAEVVGRGAAWFINLSPDFVAFPAAKPLTAGPFDIQKADPGQRFDVNHWQGDSRHYWLKVEDGRIHSTHANGAVY